MSRCTPIPGRPIISAQTGGVGGVIWCEFLLSSQSPSGARQWIWWCDWAPHAGLSRLKSRLTSAHTKTKHFARTDLCPVSLNETNCLLTSDAYALSIAQELFGSVYTWSQFIRKVPAVLHTFNPDSGENALAKYRQFLRFTGLFPACQVQGYDVSIRLTLQVFKNKSLQSANRKAASSVCSWTLYSRKKSRTFKGWLISFKL